MVEDDPTETRTTLIMDIATIMTMIKDMIEHLVQQDASNKITNDRFDVTTTAVTLHVADNDKPVTIIKKTTLSYQQPYRLGSQPSNKPANRYNAGYHRKNLQGTESLKRMCPC